MLSSSRLSIHYMELCLENLEHTPNKYGKMNRHISGLFLSAVVRPMLDSMQSAKEAPAPALSDVVAGVTGKKA
ncbi:hypothetical protein RND81_14G242400 [Saponaria officinalis]|uniref:Uncharacterized protein n=1 Tax=Saponaria officinalis TaxID=3572 RepID=A0AAW1GWE3_SAPOF